jgi:hypothetical protein
LQKLRGGWSSERKFKSSDYYVFTWEGGTLKRLNKVTWEIDTPTEEEIYIPKVERKYSDEAWFIWPKVPLTEEEEIAQLNSSQEPEIRRKSVRVWSKVSWSDNLAETIKELSIN